MKRETIKKLSVQEKFKGFRLDQFLVKIQAVKTRSQALKLISEKKVLLEKSSLKPSYRLNGGEDLMLIIPKSKPDGLSRYDSPLDILFEDEAILVINKPAALVVHPGPGHTDNTLVNILFHQKKLSSGSHPLRPGLVHRLDKDVSGLLVLAKNKSSELHLIEQFKSKQAQREYWAISLRPPYPDKGVIETWIARHPKNRQKFMSYKNNPSRGKKAITSYELFCKHSSGLSWVKCRLQTGRTHQIRVHFSSILCPILGDELYGGKKSSFIKDTGLKIEIQNLNRISLHAQYLSFIHPLSKKKISFTSSWPSDLEDLIKKLGFGKYMDPIKI